MQPDQTCLFCKMAKGIIPVSKIFENDSFFCIRDIHPQAKVHFLVIPKKHIPSLAEAFSEGKQGEGELMGALLETATQVARQQGLLPGGFRCVVNTQKDAGQTVFHIHLHVLGGESLKSGFGCVTIRIPDQKYFLCGGASSGRGG